MIDLVDVVAAHGEGDPPAQVDDAPEEIGQDEGLHWPDDGLGSGHVDVLLALHEVLDDLFGLVEVVDVSEIAVLEDALGPALQGSERVLAPLDHLIEGAVLREYVDGEESFLLEDQLQHALEVLVLRRGVEQLAVGPEENVVVLELFLLELSLVPVFAALEVQLVGLVQLQVHAVTEVDDLDGQRVVG